MVKSASIVRNLSKNYTFRTIASVLVYTLPRYPANAKVWPDDKYQTQNADYIVVDGTGLYTKSFSLKHPH